MNEDPLEHRPIQLNMKLLPKIDPGDDGPGTIKIEGDARSLQYLADRITALLQEEDCGVQLMVELGIFSEDTQYDLYLHRLPCINDILRARAREESQAEDGN